MKSKLLCALVVAAVTLVVAAASAEASQVQIIATCTTGTTIYPATLTVNTKAAAFEPRFFVTNTATGQFLGVLIVTSGTDLFSNPGIPVSGISGKLTTCTFTTFKPFVFTGILAPV